MRRTFLLVTIGLTFFYLAPANGAEPKVKKALFIGIDGTRFDAIRKAATPNLDSLASQGIVADNCLILGSRYRGNDTVSGPGWSSILTGVWADKHGVNDNSFRGRSYDAYPHFFARLKSHLPESRTASVVTWQPIDDFIVSGADLHVAIEDKSHDYEKFDAAAAKIAVRELQNDGLTCLFVYFGQVDVTGHQRGFNPAVPEYLTAIERVDKLLGDVLAAVRSRDSYDREDWLIVVTSDHGGKGTGHGGGHNSPEILNSFLIVSGDAAARGTFTEQTYIVDAPVTVLSHLGVPLAAEWKLDGRAVGLKAGDQTTD